MVVARVGVERADRDPARTQLRVRVLHEPADVRAHKAAGGMHQNSRSLPTPDTRHSLQHEDTPAPEAGRRLSALAPLGTRVSTPARRPCAAPGGPLAAPAPRRLGTPAVLIMTNRLCAAPSAHGKRPLHAQERRACALATREPCRLVHDEVPGELLHAQERRACNVGTREPCGCCTTGSKGSFCMPRSAACYLATGEPCGWCTMGPKETTQVSTHAAVRREKSPTIGGWHLMPAMPLLRMVGMLQRMSVQLELVSPVQCAAYDPLPRNVDLTRQRARGPTQAGYGGTSAEGAGMGCSRQVRAAALQPRLIEHVWSQTASLGGERAGLGISFLHQQGRCREAGTWWLQGPAAKQLQASPQGEEGSVQQLASTQRMLPWCGARQRQVCSGCQHTAPHLVRMNWRLLRRDCRVLAVAIVSSMPYRLCAL